MKPVAQTNLQLYAQLVPTFGFGLDLERIQRAYLFVAECSSGLMRGSGKPFVCHLVGTASLLAEAGEDADGVVAGLLHATYQNRMPFPGDAALQVRRAFVREQFGDVVEDLVFQYQDFEVAELDQMSDDQLRTRTRVVKMRLSDEAEDLLDHGVIVHGRPCDDASVGGSAASRRQQKAKLGPHLLRAARAISAPTLEARVAYWLDQTAEARWPGELCTGQYSSYSYREDWFK